MLKAVQLRSLIDRTLKDMGGRFYSAGAANLIFGTGLVKSKFYYIAQYPSNIAKGFFQIEPPTAVDNIENWVKFRKSVRPSLVDATYVEDIYWVEPTEKDWGNILESNIRAGIVHARLLYWRAPAKLPRTVPEMADYWVKYYNRGGKGTSSKFMKAWGKHALV